MRVVADPSDQGNGQSLNDQVNNDDSHHNSVCEDQGCHLRAPVVFANCNIALTIGLIRLITSDLAIIAEALHVAVAVAHCHAFLLHGIIRFELKDGAGLHRSLIVCSNKLAAVSNDGVLIESVVRYLGEDKDHNKRDQER